MSWWLVLLGTFSTLLGGVIGAAAHLVSQRVAIHAEEKHERSARADNRREVCREAVIAFINAAQDIDQVASHERDRPKELLHEMWARCRYLSIVASDQLQQPLRDFANALNAVYWHGTPNGEEVWRYLERPREHFHRAARHELDADVD